MSRRRIPRDARELAIRMLAHGESTCSGDSKAMKELRRRGLVRQTRNEVSVTPERARVIEAFILTPRGVQVAEQLSRNRAGHDLCWELK